MRLVFDCRFIRIDNHDGISRFSSELFREISHLVPTTALIFDKRQLGLLPEATEYILANDPKDGLRELFIARLLNKSGATHVFSPMQTMGSFGRKYKLVLTLHDLIYYTHATAPPALPLHVRIAWRIYHINFWAVRHLLNRADAVVTVSMTSKGLIQQHKLTLKPVHLVYNAAGSLNIDGLIPSEKSVAGRNQLIYMGSFMPYKNVECLIDAVKVLPDFELNLLSKISHRRKAELEARAGGAVDRIKFHNGVSDQEYANLLEGAFALVTASKDEGFGIPIIEAMSRAIPVIASNIPIFREVASSAGSYFDPTNPTELCSAITRLSEPGKWSAASNNCLSRSAFFSWKDSAQALLRAIKDT